MCFWLLLEANCYVIFYMNKALQMTHHFRDRKKFPTWIDKLQLMALSNLWLAMLVSASNPRTIRAYAYAC
jgi:hypothetical protein